MSWFLPGSNRRPCPCEGHVITTTLRNLAGREANSLFEILSGSKCGMDLSQQCTTGSRGATDNASDYGSEDCRFESCRDRQFFGLIYTIISTKSFAPPGGLEPPTFRLTAERASQLRHGGNCTEWGRAITTHHNFSFLRCKLKFSTQS